MRDADQRTGVSAKNAALTSSSHLPQCRELSPSGNVVDIRPFRIKRAQSELDELRKEHRERGMVLADLEMCALWQQLAEELGEIEDLIALRESELERSIERLREEASR